MENVASGRARFVPAFRPLEAWRAVRALIADPRDTAQVFTIIDSLSGRSMQRLTQRFIADPTGKRLFETRANILPILEDRAGLARMPKGSLAHAYLGFVEREGLDADGLVAASMSGRSERTVDDEAFSYVSDRIRDTHDLWHAVTGYHGDIIGEASILAFTLPHVWNPGVAVIIAAAALQFRSAEFNEHLVRGFRIGSRAAWLPAAPWEELLELPLDSVRRILHIEPVPAYVPVRTFDGIPTALAA